MALQVEAGQKTFGTGSSSQVFSLSDGTITPKCIILWTHGGVANGTNIAGASFSFGFSDGTNHRCMSWASNDAAATSLCGRTFRTANALEILTDGTPTTGVGGTVTGVSFAAGSFTLTTNANPASAWIFEYMVFGGADITNQKVGSFALNTTTGSQSTTDPGFKPNFVLLITAALTASGTATGAENSIGFAVGNTKREACGIGVTNGATMSSSMNANSMVRNTACITSVSPVSGLENFLADFTSMNDTGFTINIITASGSAWLLGYLAIAGGQWDVGNSVKPTTATAQTVTGEPFQPKGLFLINVHLTSLGVALAPNNFTVGAATGASNRAYAGADEEKLVPTVAKKSARSTKCIAELATTAVEADWTSFNSAGWTITWASAGVADNIGWFTMADSIKLAQNSLMMVGAGI